MGTIRHHTIVVTISDWAAARKEDGGIAVADELELELYKYIHARAMEICPDLVSNLVASHRNGYYSFFVAPDGSKEGWEASIQGDENRCELIELLREWKGPVDWVELTSYDEEGAPTILQSSSD